MLMSAKKRTHTHRTGRTIAVHLMAVDHRVCFVYVLPYPFVYTWFNIILITTFLCHFPVLSFEPNMWIFTINCACSSYNLISFSYHVINHLSVVFPTEIGPYHLSLYLLKWAKRRNATRVSVCLKFHLLIVLMFDQANMTFLDIN